jgi:hypothetical protein
MADSSNKYFYNNVIDTSFDESDNDTQILLAMALLVHDRATLAESTWTRLRIEPQ